MQNWDTKHIIQLCKQDSQEGKKVLFEMYSPKMLSLCMRYVGNTQDAQDAMIEGFISVYENINKFKDDNLQGWINRIMINSCLKLIKQKNRFLLQEDNDFFDTAEETEIENPERFSKEDIMNALQSISESERTIFNMSVIDGYTHADIAKILKIKKSSVTSVLYRTKTKLKNYLINIEEERN